MATVDEIFASAMGVDNSVEGHIVIGRDRIVRVPDTLKRLAVQYDHNIETVTFDCPRYWDEHDMSKMSVYINYIRADKVSDVYPAKNVRVDATDDTIMHFDWTISRNVSEASGKIVFLVCVKKADEEGYEQNHWNSERCTDCYVSEGLEIEESVIELMPDLIERWYEEVIKMSNETSAELTAKVDDKIAEVDEKIVELTNSVTDVNQSVDKVNNAISDLTDTVDNKISEVDGVVSEATDALNKKASELTETVDKAIDNLTTTVEDAITSANEKVENTTNELLAAKEAGEFNGATFTPIVSENGDLSWSNDKGLTNPETVNIKGARGDDGVSPVITVTPITDGHRITITDANGTQSIDVKNGVVEFTDTSALDEYMNEYVVIGDTEPTSGPKFWFDTSARSVIEHIIMLQLGEFTEDAAVVAKMDETDYSVTNASEPTETSVKDTYAIQIN